MKPQFILVAVPAGSLRENLAYSLRRRFPAAQCLFSSLTDATALLEARAFDAAVVQCNGEPQAHTFFARARTLRQDIALIALTHPEQATDAVLAGASRALAHEAWLLAAPAIAEICLLSQTLSAPTPKLPATGHSDAA